MSVPDENIASTLVERATGRPVNSITRFTTGNHHYVYDVMLSDEQNVVMRMTTSAERKSMEGAVTWNHRLREQSIPLPKIHSTDLEGKFPYIIMERLPGRDLQFEIEDMSDSALQKLASQLMDFQKTVGLFPPGEGFGYATEPTEASYSSWRAVLLKSIKRSRVRIKDKGFVDKKCLKVLKVSLSACTSELDEIKPTPFLHDITTKNVIVSDEKLTGIVDVDSLCYGDPLFQIALTRMALLSSDENTYYIDCLLNEYGEHSKELLRLYTIECCIQFLSVLGLPMNGNIIEATEDHRDKLLAILYSL